MAPEDLIRKYYPEGSLSFDYLFIHSQKVTEAALSIAAHNPSLHPDTERVRWSAMLHDIGIFMTQAPEIGCTGPFPYIAHGYLGRELLEKEGLYEIAPVCERHIGVGISLNDIVVNNMPLPHREMVPVTIEEKIVCYADKFYSKSDRYLTTPRPIEHIRKKIKKYGEDKIGIFEEFVGLFGVIYLYE
ncbi:MAG TPA: HD domain-containing protein [Bacteroidales bacterium]|nr:HD domain-containing protein [Bacteroidales bacterium]HNS47324.1 HD domain-containing protein [Bacteroidales bacterium]